ncbi:hypothetical protein XA68_15816 [Ophiocordyceps unilateralis]|uniref:Uncharacterized protein n=1 Tax=Ophiocordyceps unilateralis TaxID=268505 RepID=A0A2A9P625_OPHUN|nr:hypothetical protein XA68_15816 [Ophiocordyceps unilateralis]
MKFSEVFISAICATSAAVALTTPNQGGQDLAYRSVGVEGVPAGEPLAARDLNDESALERRHPAKGKKGKKGKGAKKGAKAAKVAKAAKAGNKKGKGKGKGKGNKANKANNNNNIQANAQNNPGLADQLNAIKGN